MREIALEVIQVILYSLIILAMFTLIADERWLDDVRAIVVLAGCGAFLYHLRRAA